MKKNVQIIFAALAGLGIVLLIVSLIMYGGNFAKLGSTIDWQEKDYVAQKPVEKICVEETSNPVRIHTGDVKNVTIHYFESDNMDYKISENNGVLSVKRNNHSSNYIFFNYNFVDIYVEITVPNDYDKEVEIVTTSSSVKCYDLTTSNLNVSNTSGGIKLDNLKTKDCYVKNTSGGIKITNLDAASVFAENTSGSIQVEDVTCDELEASNTSGHIRLENVTTESVDAENNSGGITLTDVTADEVIAGSSSGSITLENLEVGREAELSCKSGGIHGTIVGSEEDFTILSNTTSGSNNLNDHIGKEKALNVETTSGSIRIDFTK